MQTAESTNDESAKMTSLADIRQSDLSRWKEIVADRWRHSQGENQNGVQRE